MSRPLVLPGDLAAAVMAHARQELPNEACGLLAGSRRDLTATRYHPARNADASPLRFSVHPEDLVRITYAIEGAGQELIAIVHSHARSPAVPSPTDLRAAALHPGALHLIVSLADPPAGPHAAFRAWRIDAGQPSEVRLAIGQSTGSTDRTSPLPSSRTTSSPGAPSSPPDR